MITVMMTMMGFQNTLPTKQLQGSFDRGRNNVHKRIIYAGKLICFEFVHKVKKSLSQENSVFQVATVKFKFVPNHLKNMTSNL